MNTELYKKQLDGKLRGKVFSSQLIDKMGRKTTVKVAVLLNHFLVGQGGSSAEAIKNLNIIIASTLWGNHSHTQEALAGIKPAPKEYWDKKSDLEFIADPFEWRVIQ